MNDHGTAIRLLVRLSTGIDLSLVSLVSLLSLGFSFSSVAWLAHFWFFFPMHATQLVREWRWASGFRLFFLDDVDLIRGAARGAQLSSQRRIREERAFNQSWRRQSWPSLLLIKPWIIRCLRVGPKRIGHTQKIIRRKDSVFFYLMITFRPRRNGRRNLTTTYPQATACFIFL